MAERASERRAAHVIAFGSGVETTTTREIAVEAPVNVVCGGIPFAVMMLTPADLEDFAFGFALTEGIIERADQLRGVLVSREALGIHLDLDLAPDRLHAHLARRRALSGRTGCGVCGIDDLAVLQRARATPPAEPVVIASSAIMHALQSLDEAQTLNRNTGAAHAAAFARRDGTLVLVREDVGRHNALDKLIGACVRDSIAPGDGFVLITSRCSFEMVEKTAIFGARTLVAISAPTTLALDRAQALGVTLVGIARRDTMTVFSGAVAAAEKVMA